MLYSKAMWQSVLAAFDERARWYKGDPEHNYLCHRAAECLTGDIGGPAHVYMVQEALDNHDIKATGSFDRKGEASCIPSPDVKAAANIRRRYFLLDRIAEYDQV